MSDKKDQVQDLTPEQVESAKVAHAAGFITYATTAGGKTEAEASEMLKKGNAQAEKNEQAFMTKQAALGDMRTTILETLGKKSA